MGIKVKRRVEETTEVTCDMCDKELEESKEGIWDGVELYQLTEGEYCKIEQHDDVKIFCKSCYDALPLWVKKHLPSILNAESEIPLSELKNLKKEKVYVLFGSKEDEGLFFSCDSVDEAKRAISETIEQSDADNCWFEVIVINGKPYAQIETQVRIKGYDEEDDYLRKEIVRDTHLQKEGKEIRVSPVILVVLLTISLYICWRVDIYWREGD